MTALLDQLRDLRIDRIDAIEERIVRLPFVKPFSIGPLRTFEGPLRDL